MTKRHWAILGVSLALLGTCGLSLAITWSTLRLAEGTGPGRWRLFGFDRAVASASETATHRVGARPELVIRSSGGGITVTAGSPGVIDVTMKRTARAATAAEAQAELEALVVQSQLEGDTLTLTFEAPKQGSLVGNPGQSLVGFTVEVPREARLDLETEFGPVTLAGTAGAARLATAFGDIAVRDREGDGPLDLSSSFGALRWTGGSAGPVSLNTDFGTITATDFRAARLDAETANGGIRLESGQVAGDLQARSDFGRLELAEVAAASYALGTANGGISVTGSRGPLSARSQFGSLDISGAREAVLDLATSNGGIRFAGSLAPRGEHTVRSDFGRISVAVPEESRLDVVLQSDFGGVDSELPLLVQGSQGREGDRLAGTLNGGGSPLTMRSANGSVTLKRLAGTASTE